MPRVLRVEVDDALYHVHAKAAPGRSLFDDLEEARDFVKLLRELADRDGLSVYAWVLLPTSYHMAVRTATLPLSRTMHALQGRYAQAYNRRHSSLGSVWNDRFHARWVADVEWQRELVLYIHAQPLTCGLVDDPLAHLFSGHSELVGRDRNHLVDVAAVLACFSPDLDEARQVYTASLRRAVHERWCQGPATALPWWKFREVPGPDSRTRSRTGLSARQLVTAGCRALGVERDEVTSRRRARDAVLCRQVIATVGAETFGLRTKDIAEAMGKNADWISCVSTRGSRRRKADPAFRDLCEQVEAALSESDGAEIEVDDVTTIPVSASQPEAEREPEQEPSPTDSWAVWS